MLRGWRCWRVARGSAALEAPCLEQPRSARSSVEQPGSELHLLLALADRFSLEKRRKQPVSDVSRAWTETMTAGRVG